MIRLVYAHRVLLIVLCDLLRPHNDLHAPRRRVFVGCQGNRLSFRVKVKNRGILAAELIPLIVNGADHRILGAAQDRRLIQAVSRLVEHVSEPV